MFLGFLLFHGNSALIGLLNSIEAGLGNPAYVILWFDII